MSDIYDHLAEVYNNSHYTEFSARMAPAAVRLVTRCGASPQRVLDLACGVGVAAVYFADCGYDVLAIDRSEAMLRCARRRVREAGAAVQFSRQDMRSFGISGPVDLVTCMYGSLNYILSDDELDAICHRVARSLSPGGLFIFDVATRYGLAVDWDKDLVHKNDRGDLIVHRNQFDYETFINTKKLTLFVKRDTGYRRFTEIHREKAHSLETIDRALAAAGTEILHKYSGVELAPLTADAPRAVYLARRA